MVAETVAKKATPHDAGIGQDEAAVGSPLAKKPSQGKEATQEGAPAPRAKSLGRSTPLDPRPSFKKPGEQCKVSEIAKSYPKWDVSRPGSQSRARNGTVSGLSLSGRRRCFLHPWGREIVSSPHGPINAERVFPSPIGHIKTEKLFPLSNQT
jgi:hypothetical protein